MDILNTKSLESNSKIKINFAGGDLTSDAGLLLIKEFINKLGFVKLLKSEFKTKDNASFRYHKDAENLLQMIYQIIMAYFQDDCADELTTEPVFTAILEKNTLASQPTLSRFFNRMDESTLNQFHELMTKFREIVYTVKTPELMLLDLDSTLLNTYGHQEGEDFNFHYQSHGYHPLVCYDGITGDLLKIQLRDGTDYSSTGVVEFLQPLLMEFQNNYPDIPLLLRGDSGFTKPELYEQCEVNGVSYVIRLKENKLLRKLADHIDERLTDATKNDMCSYAVQYGEFMYQSGSWKYPRRVVCKVEKPYGQFIHMYTFIVTNMESSPAQLIKFYCKRGTMENFIKESKNGFDFAAVSSSSKIVNANRVQVHALAYNIFNWFKRLVLPISIRRQLVDTIRLKLLKIAAKVVHSARYITFKLCSSCPYKTEFYETLNNIRGLRPKLE
ncbi:Transposase DDE domain group 1 [Hathewaya proteolytica DSM 3090]|uniref:Transposase DDE domain group 1 n=1 Tax=Hathewaya proteolytica DSM 3090 TaxID=1121331 RepID=A0A1M6RAZ5_9CLOT|nr:IS1380 family transposase [Hathewaya proteolytica]SHK29655.1 Transposase DDE domain group 1 [Hathewaya proteolytica DSM 3090]